MISSAGGIPELFLLVIGTLVAVQQIVDALQTEFTEIVLTRVDQFQRLRLWRARLSAIDRTSEGLRSRLRRKDLPIVLRELNDRTGWMS